MPKKCKNSLSTVTATIAYYMELSDMTNKEVCQKLMMSFPTWIDKKKNPDKFTLGDLNILSKIFGIDIMVLVGGLIPKEKGEV